MITSYIFALASFIALIAGQGFNPPGGIHPACLECICQASSGCKNDGCHSGGPGLYYCGAFQVSYGYWVDGGRQGADANNPLDFEACLNNRNCAEGTVRGYMTKWSHDCDNNGILDCYDHARVHKAGPYGCNGTWVTTTDYWKVFVQCYSNINNYG